MPRVQRISLKASIHGKSLRESVFDICDQLDIVYGAVNKNASSVERIEGVVNQRINPLTNRATIEEVRQESEEFALMMSV